MHLRSHMTKRKALSLKKRYKQSNEEFKPVGLWYSLDDEWAEWCWCSMPQWITKYSHYLEVDLSRILVIETPDDLQRFEDEFSVQIRQSRFRSLNWKSVAEKYSGIEIRNLWIAGNRHFHFIFPAKRNLRGFSRTAPPPQ